MVDVMGRRALLLFLVLGFGCSKEEPGCEKDAQCTSATTACTTGVCRDGSCLAQPVAEGTRLADQTPVKNKLCVQLKCDKAGRAVEVADGSKVPPQVACKQSSCDGTTPKTENILDGVPCESGNGTCRGGVCQPNGDSGPPPVDTGMAETEVDSASD